MVNTAKTAGGLFNRVDYRIRSGPVFAGLPCFDRAVLRVPPFSHQHQHKTSQLGWLGIWHRVFCAGAQLDCRAVFSGYCQPWLDGTLCTDRSFSRFGAVLGRGLWAGILAGPHAGAGGVLNHSRGRAHLCFNRVPVGVTGLYLAGLGAGSTGGTDWPTRVNVYYVAWGLGRLRGT